MIELPVPTDVKSAQHNRRIARASYEKALGDRASVDKYVRMFLVESLWSAYGSLETAFRICESPIEVLAYLQLLRWVPVVGTPNTMPSVHPQKYIGKYRVDFEVTYAGRKWVIECDGHAFHERTKRQAALDKARDRWLSVHGYTVLRFTGSEVVKDPSVITNYLDCCLNAEYAEWTLSEHQRG